MPKVALDKFDPLGKALAIGRDLEGCGSYRAAV